MFRITQLTEQQTNYIDEQLEAYDNNYMKVRPEGEINIGITHDGKLIAGAMASMTAFKILYVSTVYVEESFRGQGIGRKLMDEVERQALQFGATMIRLDTFNWQGYEFYKKIGYQEVGNYKNEAENFSEHFFLKRLGH